MSVLFKVATISREGGRVMKEGSSAMVNRGCHLDSTGARRRASRTAN